MSATKIVGKCDKMWGSPDSFFRFMSSILKILNMYQFDDIFCQVVELVKKKKEFYISPKILE